MDVKGKAPMPLEDIFADEVADGDAEEDEPDNGAHDGDEGDMQLAWEMLEVARTIYAEHGDAYALQLAGVNNPVLVDCYMPSQFILSFQAYQHRNQITSPGMMQMCMCSWATLDWKQSGSSQPGMTCNQHWTLSEKSFRSILYHCCCPFNTAFADAECEYHSVCSHTG
jgi:hypothetical protein